MTSNISGYSINYQKHTDDEISHRQNLSSSAPMQRISAALRMKLICGASLVEGTEKMSTDEGNHYLNVYLCARLIVLVM